MDETIVAGNSIKRWMESSSKVAARKIQATGCKESVRADV
jgi:hypothetical protein